MTAAATTALVSAGDLRGAAILGGVFVALLVAAELWRRLGSPPAEWTRKLVHLGGGVACLFFPFLVDSPWVVAVMAGAMTAVFALGGRWGLLRSLHGIDRPSRGAEYYPLAIVLLFLVAGDRPAVYVAAVLVLAVADAFAALVGSHYGRLRYEVEDEHKSVEGSLTFLVIAFLAIHLPLLLMTDLPRPLCVLAALLVATLVTGFEAISLHGADNLFVPLAVAVILIKITSKPLGEVVFQNLSLLLLATLLAVTVVRLRSFNAGGTIAFVLYTYGAWSLGSWHWALPALTGFLCFSLLGWRHRRREAEAEPDRPPGIRTRAVAFALLLPFLVLAVANGFQLGAFLFGPYLAACGSVLALSLPAVGERDGQGAAERSRGMVAAAVVAWAVTAVPAWLVQPGLSLVAPLGVGAAVVAAGLGAVAVDPRGLRERQWNAGRFLLSAAAALGVLAAQAAGWLPAWDPSWMARLGLPL